MGTEQAITTGNGAARPRSAALAVKDWMAAPTMRAAISAALTGYMSQETFAAQCYIAAQDPKLSRCSAESLFKAFLECAQMGLLPGAHHRHVALVPRGGEISVTPQWQGFKFLMERQPGVKRVRPVLVHAKDAFRIVDGEPVHEWDPFDDDRVFEHPDDAKRANRECQLRGGYLVVEYDSGDREWHFVGARKIHRNRACAQTQDIWRKWFEEMATKTVLRDAWSKRVVSIDPELAGRVGAAMVADERATGHDPARVEVQQPARPQLSERLGVAESVPDMRRAEVVDARPSDSGEHAQVPQREPGDDGDDDPTPPTGTDAPRAAQQTAAQGSTVQSAQHTGTPLDSAAPDWTQSDDAAREHIDAIESGRHLESSCRRWGHLSPVLRELYAGRAIKLGAVDDNGRAMALPAVRQMVARWSKEGPQQRAA